MGIVIFVSGTCDIFCYWKNSSVLMNSCSKATSFPNQLFLCHSELCVLCLLYFHVFLGGKNESTMLSLLSFEILNQWNFEENWCEHYIQIYMGMLCFRNLSWKSSSGLIHGVFFSVTGNMTFIVKCAPVLKEWNFCCCSCSLRAAAVVLAWIVTVSPLKLKCWK